MFNIKFYSVFFRVQFMFPETKNTPPPNVLLILEFTLLIIVEIKMEIKYNEFCARTWMYTGELVTHSNLYKGDLNYARDKILKYWNADFYLMDFSTGFRGKATEMLDYTVLDDAALFQEALVFDKKYICTLEEMIELQRRIKCIHRECIDIWCSTGEDDFCNHFNLGEV